MTFFPKSYLPFLKASLLVASMTLCSTSSFAQQIEEQGKISYNHTINIHAALPPEQAAFKALIPKEQTIQIEATFSGNAYRLKTLPAESSDGGVQIQIGGGNADLTIVKLDSNEQIRLGELVDLKFANRSPLTELTNRMEAAGDRNILGYEAKRLTGTLNFNGEDRPVEIWYTPSLPAGISPFPLSDLPGAVLELKVGDDFWSYSATSIDAADISSDRFEIPEGYREVSNEQLQDLQEEALDALRQSGAVVSRPE